MGRVVRIDTERTNRLAATIERELRRTGTRTLSVPLDEVQNVAEWRRAAIQAAHRTGERANTVVTDAHVMVLVDRPVTRREEREAAEAVSRLLFDR